MKQKDLCSVFGHERQYHEIDKTDASRSTVCGECLVSGVYKVEIQRAWHEFAEPSDKRQVN